MKSKLAIALLAIGVSDLANGQSSDRPIGWHCMDDHFREALALNEARKPLYSQISNGETDRVADALMDFERTLTANTKPLIPLVRFYWAKEVPVLCKEFAPIAHTPPYTGYFPRGVDDGPVNYVKVVPLISKLQFALLSGGQEQLIKVGRAAIQELDKADTFQCLTKHFLESIVRTAEVRDEVSSISEAAGLGSTHWITALSLQSQIVSLNTTVKIDRMAEGVHRKGINILCADVPPILD